MNKLQAEQLEGVCTLARFFLYKKMKKNFLNIEKIGEIKPSIWWGIPILAWRSPFYTFGIFIMYFIYKIVIKLLEN